MSTLQTRIPLHTLLGMALLLVNSAVLADQCELIPVEQAAKALNHIKPGSQYVPFCEPCGDQNFYQQAVQTVDELSVVKNPIDDQVYWQINLNGKGIDLAYTFVRTGDGSFLNLSKLADCPSDGVSAGFAAPASAQEPEGD